MNNNSDVPFEELWSTEASPLLTASLITTRSLRFWPKINPDDEVLGGCTDAGTVVVVLGVTFVVPRGTNFGASTSCLLSSDASVSLSLLLLSDSLTFKKGLFPDSSCAGRKTDPVMCIYIYNWIA